MDVIKNYIDNVFAAYPQTDEIKKMKQDMLGSMEDKYVMLRQGGKSEHEAAYSVIANFGSMDELTQELGVEAVPVPVPAETHTKTIFLSCEEAFNYLSSIKKSGAWIGVGVWLIISGVSAVILLENVGILFAAIAAAVAIFIINGMKMESFKSYNDTPIQMDTHTRESVERKYERFKPLFAGGIACGVAFILLGVGLIVATDNDEVNAVSSIELAPQPAARYFENIAIDENNFTFDNFTFDETEVISSVENQSDITAIIETTVRTITTNSGTQTSSSVPFSIPTFLNIVGFSVFLFIFVGTYNSAFDILLEKGDYKNKIANKKKAKIIETIAAFYWPIVTAIGLWQLFTGNHLFWLAWVIGGVAFGGIAGGIAVWENSNVKEA